jgi:hypothetical protein
MPSQKVDYPGKWFGKRYDLDDQCSLQTGKQSKFCQYSWAQTVRFVVTAWNYSRLSMDANIKTLDFMSVTAYRMGILCMVYN